jgi:hypothetical protein
MVALPTHWGYFELRQRLDLAEDVDRLHLLQLMAEELMLPKVSYRTLFETLLRLVRSSYLVCPKRSYESQNVLRS